MKIVIFGASGGTGLRIVEQAIAGGHIVTAFVRSPSKMLVQAANLTLIQGNVTDAAAVEEATGSNSSQQFKWGPRFIRMWNSLPSGYASMRLPGRAKAWHPLEFRSDDQAGNPRKYIHFYLHKISVSTRLFCQKVGVSA